MWRDNTGTSQAQASGSNLDAPRKSNFYVLGSRYEHENSPNVVTGMLQVFSIDIYALTDLGGTLSFVTKFIARMFGILPDIVNELFMVATPVGE